MYLSNYTETQQNNFASFCNTNILKPIDGLTDNRIHHYRRLIYNIIDDSLRSAYPLTEDLLQENEWKYLVDDFVAKHKSQSPQIWQMPYEFYQFVDENEFELKAKYPHLIDLFLFEWKEIELYMMEDKNDEQSNLSIEIYNYSQVVVSREYEILQLSFPVHLKPSNTISLEDKGVYYVLMFRANDKVQFFDLSPFFVWLIYKIENNNYSIEQLIKKSEESNKNINCKVIKESFLKFIYTMHSKGFILGFENESEIK
ncbi:MAG: putative DNA-binding domain-containing protein [Ignavibacteriaceae bacterium]